MCVFLTWLAEAKLSFRAEYDSFNCIRSLNRKITRECAVNPLHRNSEGIIIHGKCMLIWIRGDCFHLQTTQSHQLICTTLDNLVTCRFAFLFWQGTYGNGDRSKQKKKELRLYNNVKWRGCGHELKPVNKKKKEPKAARTPIEEDTYIYNVHVYGFLFFVENQKKKKRWWNTVK